MRSSEDSSADSLSTAIDTSSVFLAPVQTIFPEPNRSIATFGSFIR